MTLPRRLSGAKFLRLALALAVCGLGFVAWSVQARRFGAPSIPAGSINVAAGEVAINPNGLCSLREAIVNATNDAQTHADCAAGSGTDTITLAANATYTISDVDNTTDLANGLPSITTGIIIEGAGSVIERSAASGTPDFRLFQIAAAGNLTVRNATLRNGRHTATNADGGMALNRGALTLENCLVANNIADDNGGAIENFNGSLTITNCTLAGNAAIGTSGDGGVLDQGNALVTITNSTFTGNSATNAGGAVNCNSGTIACDISGSTFTGNHVTGSFGGGAIAFFNNGVKTVTNSTISGNTANADAGGIRAFSGTVNLNFVTIANNTADNDNNGSGNGGGILQSSATVNLKNSIIADNLDRGGEANDIGGTITSQGYNHVESTTGGTFSATTGDVTGSDPALTSLANNGGATQTRLPSQTSAVRDAIPNGTNGCGSTTTTDQRGFARPTDSNGDGTSACEKGAVELPTVTRVSASGIQGAAEPATYNFTFGANQVSINVTDDGTDLDILRVTEIPYSHPNRNGTMQTGRYWFIEPLKADGVTPATADYTVDLTLPLATADAPDQVCRYTGSGTLWDCAASSFVANTSVTRTGISQLSSEWAAQDLSGTGTIAGTKTVGAGGDYASLTGANGLFEAINRSIVSGDLVINITGDLNEDGTNALNQWMESGAGGYTLTIQPADGTMKTISGNVAVMNGMLRLDGADRVTIDGRFNNAGRFLTFSNTDAGNPTIAFTGDASGNAIRYCIIQGATTSQTNGVVFFGAGASTGNNNNTIDNCDIRDSAGTPANAVYASGATAQPNSGNTISNCNIFNFYAPIIDASGVRLDGGNTGWTITGNSIYQTTDRPVGGSTARGIYINAGTTGDNFTITNNTIGGSQGNTGGTAWTTTGTTLAYRFVGIQLNVGTTTPSSVQGNTIKNFVWTSSSNATALPGIWSGIYVQGGAANIGTTSGNTIGSGTGTGSVSVTTSSSGVAAFGIGSASSGAVNISNNTIGSITTNGSASTISASLVGIQVTAGTYTISNNTVGSATTANSLNAATSSTSATAQLVTGILSSGTVGATITNNTVANLNNNYAGTGAGGIRGIATSAAGANTITGNTVRNLSTTSANANATTAQSVYGITQTSTDEGQTVSQNVVHSLSNTAASANVWVTGIYYAGPVSGTNTIARNLVHSLSVSSTGISSAVNGMQFASGTFTVQNNMVRVGLDASGNSTAGASIVRGIYDFSANAGRNFYHNSVYLGGTQTGGAANTFAFTSAGTTNARTFQNNIFFNARTNGGGTGKHYAVNYSGSGVNPTGLTAGSNIFFVSGTGGVLGLYDSVDRTTLAAWQAATGQDGASQFADPLFVNPTAGTPDLHLQVNTPAEAAGTLADSVTDDFDGQTRSGLTPVDIGADAGNFAMIGNTTPTITAATGLARQKGTAASNSQIATVGDNQTAPGSLTVTATAVPNGISVANIVNAGGTITADIAADCSATEGDNTIVLEVSDGSLTATANLIVNVTANTAPTLAYGSATVNLNGSTTVNPSSTPGDNGSIVSFEVESQGTYTGTISVDASGVVFVSGAAPVGTHTITIRATDDCGLFTDAMFTLEVQPPPPISGTKTIGAGGDYPSLTGAGGLFEAINSTTVSGNVTANITGDLNEDGTNALNQWAETGAGNYTLTIQPADGAMKTISGDVANGMIRLNGADRVTIDGRFNGAGRFLTFRNIDTGNPTFTLINDASNNTIRSSVIEGAAEFKSVIFIGVGTTTGNDNNLIDGNQIRDRSDAEGVPGNLIVSQASSAPSGVRNTGNTISDNELFNFLYSGIVISETTQGKNESWTISGNTIYQTAARENFLQGIRFGSGEGTNTISGNTIRDLNSTAGAVGISLAGMANVTTVERNRIYSFPSGDTLTGIQYSGSNNSSATVANNQVTIIPTFAGDPQIVGISEGGSGTNRTFNAYYNSVLIGGTANGANSTWACQRRAGATSTHTARNNICFNNRTGGTGSHFAAGNQSTSGSFSSDYNLFVGTGSTAADFMDYGTSLSGTPVSFASWQSLTGGDSHSQAGNPGGNFNTALFADPSAGDLHVNSNVSYGTLALISNTGTPVGGVTTDYDKEARDTLTPDLGSDEVAGPTSVPTTLTVAPADGPYGGTVNLSATLTDGTNGISGQTISFTLNGNGVGSAVTDGAGVATLSGVSLAGLNAGSYADAVGASFAGAGVYLASSGSNSLTVEKATPAITWSNPADITYGTALSGTQLNAAANVGGSFVYTPAAGTVLGAGSHNLHVDFTPADTTNYNTAQKDVSINVLSALFSMTMTADRNPALVGYNHNYLIAITNTGTAAATSMTLSDPLPSQVRFTAVTTSQGTCSYNSGTHTVNCTLGTLAVGSTINIQLTTKTLQTGTLNNTATVSASQWDPATGGNTASVNGLQAIAQVDLSVSKTDSADPVYVSQQTTYTMVVKNYNTPNNATGVVLTDNLPASMTFVSATTTQGSLVTPPVGSTGIVTANIGTLAPNATATVTVTVTANSPGTITNTASASANESEANPANNTASQGTSVLAASLQKVLLAKQVLTGGCENTTGNVYLTGPAPAGGLTVNLSTTSLAGVTVPASVFIPAGQTVSPNFTVTTSPVATKQVGTVNATVGASTVSRNLTINVGSGTCP